MTIAIIGEYLTALDANWVVVHHGNLQHIMMYAFFALHPAMELLYYHKVQPLPPNLDYLAAILAFAIEAFLFHEHLHGRSQMDVQLHEYLILIVIGCVFASMLEMIFIQDVRPALARSTLTLFQGTWFYQVSVCATLYLLPLTQPRYIKINIAL